MNTPRVVGKRFVTPIHLGLVTALSVVSMASAQLVIIDGFESGEGHFADAPDFSGSSQGLITAAGPTDTTADQVFTDFFTGAASQKLVVFDNTAVPGSTANLDSWRVRHLSSRGTITSNVSLAVPVGGTSYVGYWLKTSSAGLEAAIGIDDSATALEIGRWQPILPDGEWHLYQWQFQDEVDWEPFALADANGMINSASVTIDSLFFRAGVGFPTGTAFDAIFFIDDVSYNPTGTVIPEPSSALILIAGGIGLLGRRRRP